MQKTQLTNPVTISPHSRDPLLSRGSVVSAVVGVSVVLCVMNPLHAQDPHTPNPIVGAPPLPFAVLPSYPSACPITWSLEQQISDDTSDAFYPQLARSGDTLHATYYANGVFYTHSFDNGTTWSVPQWLLPQDSIPSTYTGVVAASGSWVYILHTSTINPPATVRLTRVFRSSDAGLSWLTPVTIDRGSERAILTFEDTAYAYYLKDSVGPYLARSSDYGVSWSPVGPVPRTLGYADMVVSKHGVFFVSEAGFGNSPEVVYQRSSDFGVSWSAPVYLSTLDNITSDEPAIASDGDSLLIVGWRDGKYGSIGGFAGAMLSRRSTDLGISWEPEVRHDSLPAGNFPVLSVAGRNVSLDGEMNNSSLRCCIKYHRIAEPHGVDGTHLPPSLLLKPV